MKGALIASPFADASMVFLVRSRSAIVPRTTSQSTKSDSTTTLSSGQEMMKQFYEFQQFQEYLAWQKRQKQMQKITSTSNQQQQQPQQHTTMSFEQWKRRNYPQSAPSTDREPPPTDSRINENDNRQTSMTKTDTKTTSRTSFLPWMSTAGDTVEGASAKVDITTAKDEFATSSPVKVSNSKFPLASFQERVEQQQEQRRTVPDSSTKIDNETSSKDNMYWLRMLVESLTSRIRQVVDQGSNSSSTGGEGTEPSTVTETATNCLETATTTTTDVCWNQVLAIWETVTTQCQPYPTHAFASMNLASSDAAATGTTATPTIDDCSQHPSYFQNLGSTISDIAQSLISTCHAATPCKDRDMFTSSCSDIKGEQFRPE